jgi:hypothetical protein
MQEGEIQREPRRERMIHERMHDPYKTRLKLPEPTVRPQYGASSTRGAGIGCQRPCRRPPRV